MSILCDYEGYRQQQQLVELCILTLANRAAGFQTFEAYASLFDCEIGNARARNLLAMAYSSTGAICRAALNDLRYRKLLVDTWGQRGLPMTYFITDSGAAHLGAIMAGTEQAEGAATR